MCVCMCSTEELTQYLSEEEGAVLIDQLILQQDVVCDTSAQPYIIMCIINLHFKIKKFKKVWSDKEEKFKENHAQACE